MAVTGGPAASVWIGSDSKAAAGGANLSTGTPLTTVTLPPGLVSGDAAVNPAGATLYVSATSSTAGGVILEYNARQIWRKLAAASDGVIRYAAAGADLTAVPAVSGRHLAPE